MGLGVTDIDRLFALLEPELAARSVTGELHVVGGAVTWLAFEAREATRNVDALFRPTAEVRSAAARVAARAGVPDDWLNDAIKGFLGTRPEFRPDLELPHLRAFVAEPHYLLAMKCVVMRLGAEFHDLDDVRHLLRHLGVRSAAEALGVVARYFDEEQIPLKSRLALEEMLGH